MNRKATSGWVFTRDWAVHSVTSVLQREMHPSAEAVRRNVAAMMLSAGVKCEGPGVSNFCSGSVHANE